MPRPRRSLSRGVLVPDTRRRGRALTSKKGMRHEFQQILAILHAIKLRLRGESTKRALSLAAEHSELSIDTVRELYRLHFRDYLCIAGAELVARKALSLRECERRIERLLGDVERRQESQRRRR